MIIKTKMHDITVSSVVSEKIRKNGKIYPALKFIFDGAVSGEDIEALTFGSIEIDGNTHDGYNTLGEVSVTVGKITTAEQTAADLEKELSKVNEEYGKYVQTVKTVLPVLDDKTAVKVKNLYDEWEPDRMYAAGVRVLRGDVLYKVIDGQSHTSQSGWEPENAHSVWLAIDETHEGIFDDPIPAVSGMNYEKDKYYVYNGTLYLCIRQDSEDGTVLQFTPDQLVGQFFEIVSE